MFFLALRGNNSVNKNLIYIRDNVSYFLRLKKIKEKKEYKYMFIH